MVERRSPLAHLTAELAEAAGSAVACREQPFLAQIDVRIGRDGAAPAAAAEAIGVPLPTVPGTIARGPEWAALWLGPDEWLLLGPPGAEQTLTARLAGALGGGLGTVVDVSANRTAIEVSGPRAREVLEKGCSLDLHPRAFGAGRCAQTMLARSQVVLARESEAPAYRVLVRSSFANYLAAWLMDATMEFRADPSESRASIERRQRSVRATSLNV